jgi:hypothetical protein
MARPRAAALAAMILLSSLLFGGLILPNVGIGQRITEVPLLVQPVPSSNIPFYEEPCAQTDPHRYTNDPNKESPRSFGPAAPEVGANEAATEFYYRLCGRPDGTGGDPELYRAIYGMARGEDPNLPLVDSAWRQGVRLLVSKHIRWNEAKLVQRTSSPGTYSLYMERLANGETTVGTVEVAPRTSWFLEIPIFNGTTYIMMSLRLPCGFQPESSIDQIPSALL